MAALAQCPDPKQWQRFLLGELTETVAATLEEHIQKCPQCSRLLARLPADDTMVAAMRGNAKVALLSPEDRASLDQLMQRLQKVQPKASGDTTTGENTLGRRTDDSSEELCKFLSPAQENGELGRLGSFRVLKILGHGGMGVVFQAEDSQLKRPVAVKAMLPDVAKKVTSRERFIREARAAAALQHDHIAAIYHVGEEKGVPYLVMPLLRGASLEDFLKKQEQGKPGGALRPGQILKLGREIARGLAAAHEVGLIHRDIKPANIWLDATAGGRVKILDFGLARATTDDAQLTSPGLVVGTPSYMAPEQAQGKPVDARADLYSLGCLMYRLCTGRVPFQGSDAVSTLLLAATQEPTPLEELNPDLPPKLCELIRRLMAKAPASRFSSAKEVVEAIQQIERAPADSKTAVISRPPPRKRRWRIIAGGLLFLGVGLLLWQVVIRIKGKDDIEIIPMPDLVVEVEKGGKTAATVTATTKTLPQRAVSEEWISSTRKLPARQRVDEVGRKLVELNPEFDGKVTPKIDGNLVHDFSFNTDHVSNLEPLRALPELHRLTCAGTWPCKGQVRDLSPLSDLRHLYLLEVNHNPVADLAPLQGLPLKYARLDQGAFRTIEPLKGMPLLHLSITACWHINDLSPLRGMKLDRFTCNVSQVADLSPLADMPLKLVNCQQTRVTDLSVAKTWTGLKDISCDYKAARDADILRSIKSLEKINGKPVADFWK